MSHIQALLDRVEHVRPSGDGKWRGKCPAHQGENRATLSIRECDDGKILLHCHAHQCPPAEILQVCGLEFADIMPERIDHFSTPQRRGKWRNGANRGDWIKAANIIGRESRVVWVAAAELAAGQSLNQEDQQRLNQAVEIIDKQRKLFNGS